MTPIWELRDDLAWLRLRKLSEQEDVLPFLREYQQYLDNRFHISSQRTILAAVVQKTIWQLEAQGKEKDE